MVDGVAGRMRGLAVNIGVVYFDVMLGRGTVHGVWRDIRGAPEGICVVCGDFRGA